ncbi:Queuine/other tRNA-ribosyltransferase [Kribbella flavida DSM 17836]|uniref:Queuine/other tRNA-ribosyltransferase n=1 Tax=Kribbella flavida (strain DSM 17836 / JCM 10339 / NBRC 14399) TaxID=479435 RepID=D2PYU7_KRIFD|nr:tRNA-guanine transglycosylase DpdA [Kribbella flavida]ADB29943.1 Queuine/other tRNA-ribosyltransferase [Kribbella flavida DSM 17836]
MKFYFPDSQDLVSPTYDFLHDEYSPLRVRQRDDLYAHEVLSRPPYDGILVSKAIVDGSVRGAGKYTAPQRARLHRLGVRKFFRLPRGVETLGDNGAFNYVEERIPPVTVRETLDFYQECGFDAGVSVDHVIFGYDPDATPETVDTEWAERRLLTLRLAAEFIEAVDAGNSTIQPVGAAQGWSPDSYADSVRQLQSMGYRRIALGGMVPLKTPDIIRCLEKIAEVRRPETQLHLLGITRIESMEEFARLGIASFDSTSAFRQSFMDDRRNYHSPETDYVAVRVPQVEGNSTLKRNILGGVVSQRDAIRTERECLRRLRRYDSGDCPLESVLDALSQYEAITKSEKTYLDAYRRTLEATPWKACSCALCREHGIEIIIFRGTERNKRRGFHNLSVLFKKMKKLTLCSTNGSRRG